MELKHQFSDCNSSWKPMLYRYAIDSVRTQIELIQCNELNNNPYVSILPDIKSINSTVSEFYVQFIPICTDEKITSYEYSISIDDETSCFDIYFVNLKKQLENYLNYNFFDFYTDDGCFDKNYHSFSGICTNINQESGLLIIIPDNLNRSLTKIGVNILDNYLEITLLTANPTQFFEIHKHDNCRYCRCKNYDYKRGKGT